MDRHDVGDRQLDALLERLDRLCDEMHTLNKRLDSSDQLLRISRELSTLNESLQALAYVRWDSKRLRSGGAEPASSSAPPRSLRRGDDQCHSTLRRR